nr:Chain A, ATP synthase beta chain, mitochondrial precursor [Nicotiana plumbaginifolia]
MASRRLLASLLRQSAQRGGGLISRSLGNSIPKSASRASSRASPKGFLLNRAVQY